MKLLCSFLILHFAFVISSRAYTLDTPNKIASTDGSRNDVANAFADAAVVDTWTINIPAGSFTWTNQLSVTGKGVKFKGQGSGGVEARSVSSVAIGTGSKTFTCEAGRGFSAGQTFIARTTHNSGNYMFGTVTSYSGTTLVVEISSVGGSGTFAFWALCIWHTTEVKHAAGGVILISVTEDATDSVEFTGIKFQEVSGSANFGDFIKVFSGGQPVKIHDCDFSMLGTMSAAIRMASNSGLIWDCSFDSGFYSGTGIADGSDDQAITFQHNGASSWTTASTMGTNDTTGKNNVYVEDCRFTGMYLQAMDFSDNGRAVVRYNIFDNAALSSHGVDTGEYGARHWELYNNTFYFNDIGALTYAMGYIFFIRGGTGIIADNIIPNLNSSTWGDKGELVFTLYNIRKTSIYYSPCPTAYPTIHQPGQSHNGTSLFIDPIYISGNSGGGDYGAPGHNDFQPDQCGNGLVASSFIQSGRDYILNTARPNYAKYTYPHPLRTEDTPPPDAPPSLVRTRIAGNVRTTGNVR